MISFVSTRGHGPVSFADALLQGLAPDGGLYVPERIPGLPAAGPDRDGTFADTAAWAARHLLAVDREMHVVAMAEDALPFEVPLVEVEPDLWVLELFHGPSLAFKDVGARFMAQAVAAVGAGRGREAGPEALDIVPLTVLVATSGDTGGAVASAFHDLPGTRVVALFPSDGISPRQRRQMTTLGGNVTAVSVDGTFDDCQRMAKTAFADDALRDTCRLTSANSINVGRLLPQAFYYIHTAARLGWEAEPATFVVPSGNLGNLCAGLLAHRAGMPAAGFVAASNTNRVFPDYLEAGTFTPRPSHPTPSNAMDVGDPSNLERIRWLYGEDVSALRADVAGFSVDGSQTRDTIADVFQRTGYVLDPHGAVGYRAAHEMGLPAGRPMVVLATAHPAKFPDVVEEVTGQPVALPETLARLMDEPEDWVEIGPTDAELRRILTTSP